MNWFVFTIGCLWLCGSIKEAISHNYPFAIIYVCYAIASFALATVGK
jgi:hypothetical protein